MSFLTVEHLEPARIESLVDQAGNFLEVLGRDRPKVPALAGKSVAMMFFEPSMQTRMSFERAARALSADTMSIDPTGGGTLRDTTRNVQAMGADLLVVSHPAAGAPGRVAAWSGLPVVNAGDGAHEDPTQAMVDCLTIRRHFAKLSGLRIALVGDIRHSRIARSGLQVFTKLGASVTLVAPRTLQPVDTEGWPVETVASFEAILEATDVVYMLPIRKEGGVFVPSIPEYARRFGLSEERAALLPSHAMVMHTGEEAVAIAPPVLEGPRSLAMAQVTNGIAVRMAVLFEELAGRREAA